MMDTSLDASLTGCERTFETDDIIVSKTNVKGLLTYVNDTFVKISGYDEDELIGKPHSIIRNPKMPKAIFKLLWDSILSGREIFAYVDNKSKNGDNYWVFAHVTPTFGVGGEILGFHSNRRVARAEALAVIKPLYSSLLKVERGSPDSRSAVEASSKMLVQFLEQKGASYDEFIFSL